MKIAHINMFYLPTFGGVEQVMYELAKRQVNDGHEVHVFCCDSDKYKRLKVKEETIEGVHVHRYPYWFRLSLSTFIWPSLLWKLPKYNFDIIHSHVSGHAYILIAGIVARKKNTIHVHTTHCPWTDAFRPWKVKIPLFFANLFFNRLAFKYTTKIVAITPWELDILKKWTLDKKIIVITNGTDEILFRKVRINNFKKNNKIKGKLVLFFGRLNYTKGPEKLAQAAVEISKERKKVNFAWIGPDEGAADEVKRIIEGHKNMMYLGPIRGKDKIAEMYQAADVYVLPSYREGMPLTLFEAYASGLPVIASPVNGISYEMEEGVNGYFVDYGDIENLKKRILEVLDNKKLALKFGKNNIKKAKSYSWGIIYKRYMDLYNELLKKKS
ncbi:glycosyltransferase family 4 protein [Candidatus Woesearchaeota archaeon]|nr:glycosyltransferase family 4 protein [Candidatus Woesearchaeota archaeon]